MVTRNPFFLCAAQVQTGLVELLCREPVRGGELAKLDPESFSELSSDFPDFDRALCQPSCLMKAKRPGLCAEEGSGDRGEVSPTLPPWKAFVVQCQEN